MQIYQIPYDKAELVLDIVNRGRFFKRKKQNQVRINNSYKRMLIVNGLRNLKWSYQKISDFTKLSIRQCKNLEYKNRALLQNYDNCTNSNEELTQDRKNWLYTNIINKQSYFSYGKYGFHCKSHKASKADLVYLLEEFTKKAILTGINPNELEFLPNLIQKFDLTKKENKGYDHDKKQNSYSKFKNCTFSGDNEPMNLELLKAQFKRVAAADLFIGTPIKQFDNGTAIVVANDENYEFVTINPLKECSKTAADSNVAELKSFLFEFDTLSMNDQVRYAKKNIDKINRILFSGSKSLHIRVTIEDEPEYKEQYKYIWNLINYCLFDSKADKSCSNPARLTRAPNKLRKNGNKQERLHLSETVYNLDWRHSWENEKVQIIAKYKHEKQKTNTHELLNRNIPIEARKLLTNNFKDGERHSQIWKAISFLKFAGWTKEDVTPYVKDTGIKDWQGIINHVFR
jgi:hypothetical protein